MILIDIIHERSLPVGLVDRQILGYSTKVSLISFTSSEDVAAPAGQHGLIRVFVLNGILRVCPLWWLLKNHWSFAINKLGIPLLSYEEWWECISWWMEGDSLQSRVLLQSTLPCFLLPTCHRLAEGHTCRSSHEQGSGRAKRWTFTLHFENKSSPFHFFWPSKTGSLVT